jgi:hypothetical protein
MAGIRGNTIGAANTATFWQATTIVDYIAEVDLTVTYEEAGQSGIRRSRVECRLGM